MRKLTIGLLAFAGIGLGCSGCESARLSVRDGMGPDPVLPAPKKTPIPTVNIAPATGWAAGTTPTAAPGFAVNALATGLDHPRWLYVLPNGDVLVAETNGPGKGGIKGIKGKVMGAVMKKAGAAVPSANRISLLRDADGDGVAETRTVFLQGLSSPFGMALVGETLYVANADTLVKVPYRSGETSIGAAPVKVVDLPGGGELNHHWTKSLLASRDGSRLYIGVGSNSNAGENGMAAEANRAAVLEVDPASGATRVFASGIRNPVGIGWQPQSGALWVAVNERDELGSDLVPDYMTSVRPGGFYGWPYSYYGQHVDTRVKPPRPDLVASAIKPDYALGPHTGSLGLTFYDGTLFPARYAGGAFVGQHGSWNRDPPSGYKVIFVPFVAGMPSGPAEDVLTGFLDDRGNARGRPVGVAVDARGALLVADDVGNVIWRVTPAVR
ncbi:MAG TPA: sorbosone dehydrogenase family protein [Xanthomonadaceae bacterium]|nr:sorbosone dehydrogenase family protein [Xanthomonadaceae bacterium]